MININNLKQQKEELSKRLDDLNKQLENYYTLKEEIRLTNLELHKINCQILKNERQTYVGKCFKAITDGYKGVRAFKIINILNPPNEEYAVCLSVTEKDDNTAFSEYSKGLRKLVLPVWGSANLRQYNINNDLVINKYKEININEFKLMCDETIREVFYEQEEKKRPE